MAKAIDHWEFTTHALAEMARRRISSETVTAVLRAPEQRLPVRAGRDVLQSRFMLDGKQFIVRVFVDVDRHPADIVTVYRSSKIDKYWSPGS